MLANVGVSADGVFFTLNEIFIMDHLIFFIVMIFNCACLAPTCPATMILRIVMWEVTGQGIGHGGVAH